MDKLKRENVILSRIIKFEKDETRKIELVSRVTENQAKIDSYIRGN